MKSAKDMFEELGYKQEIKNNVIYYLKEIHIPKSKNIYSINFINDKKEVFVSKNIDVKELQAISQQINELGWK